MNMPKWKKLNPETGLYEEIPNAASGGGLLDSKSTIGVPDAYTTYPMADVATNSSVGATMTTYTVENLVKGDIIKTRRQYNGQTGIIRDANGNDLTSKIAWKEYVNGTFTLDQDYAVLKVQCYNGYENEASVSVREGYLVNRPAYGGEYVPTINDDDDTTLKTLSSSKIFDMLGGSEKRAKDALNGKVWIAMGDSYTRGMDAQLQAIAAKYGMILDNRGIVSSSICGDTTGNKGFQPMWNRANGAVNDYTAGYTINGVTYTTDDVGLITFMGGANDGFGINTWIGSGRADMDTNHIYGALNVIYNAFGENFPNAKMITITQPAHYKLTIDETVTDETAQLWGFADAASYLKMTDVQMSNYSMAIKEAAVREMAWTYESHLVDAFAMFPTVMNPANRTAYWQEDKLHLNATGYQMVADMLEQDGILKVFGR